MYKLTVYLTSDERESIEGVKDYNMGDGFLEVILGDKEIRYFNIDKVSKFNITLVGN